MEEKFLHAWDELDDMFCLCRHVATVAVTEALGSSLSVLAPAAGGLLAGALTLMLAARQFLHFSA
jgi:hypothetical protein